MNFSDPNADTNKKCIRTRFEWVVLKCNWFIKVLDSVGQNENHNTLYTSDVKTKNQQSVSLVIGLIKVVTPDDVDYVTLHEIDCRVFNFLILTCGVYTNVLWYIIYEIHSFSTLRNHSATQNALFWVLFYLLIKLLLFYGTY